MKLEDTNPIIVCAADGFKVQSTQVCRQFKWSSQGHEFCNEITVLPLGGEDVVLGVQWLKTLGPVTFDFNSLQLQFVQDGDQITLQGENTDVPPTIHLMNSTEIKKVLQTTTHGNFGYLYGNNTM